MEYMLKKGSWGSFLKNSRGALTVWLLVIKANDFV